MTGAGPTGRHRAATTARGGGRRLRAPAALAVTALSVIVASSAAATVGSSAWSAGGIRSDAQVTIPVPEATAAETTAPGTTSPGTTSAQPTYRDTVWDPAARAWGVWEWHWGTRSWRLIDTIGPGAGTGAPRATVPPAPPSLDADPPSTPPSSARPGVPPTATQPPAGAAASSTPPAGASPSPTASAPAGAGSGFVQRQGVDFVQNGQVVRGTGVNLFDAAGGPGWACEHASSQEELTTAFRQLRASGARVVRFWAFQTYTAGGTDWRGVDKVIAAAKASGLLLIPTLEDGPGWCTTGPTEQAKWQVPGYYTTGYRQRYGSARLSLLDYAGVIAAHYRNEPTIAAWMIMNEAETSERDAAGRSALVSMSRTVAQAIRRVDPNHLITLGTQGNGAPGTSGADFRAIYGQPELDFAEVHDWPREGGSELTVLAGAAAGGGLPAAGGGQCASTGAPLACSFAIAKQLGKPVMVGELGVKTATAGGSARRAQAIAAKVRADQQAGAGLVVLWEARLPRDGGGEGFEVRPGSGDPLLGVLATGSR